MRKGGPVMQKLLKLVEMVENQVGIVKSGILTLNLRVSAVRNVKMDIVVRDCAERRDVGNIKI